MSPEWEKVLAYFKTLPADELKKLVEGELEDSKTLRYRIEGGLAYLWLWGKWEAFDAPSIRIRIQNMRKHGESTAIEETILKELTKC